MKLAPSILAADLADLGRAVELCEAGGADLVHFDVMDGHFVPNLSIGIPVLAALARRTSLPIDVHLMVANPERLLEQYLEAGASWVSVHWEAATHLDRLLATIRAAGAKAGVVLNPTTPIELLIDTLAQLDFVLLMSVNPGFSGQSFLPWVLEKARRLRSAVAERGLAVEIEMDGGIGLANIRQVVATGVDVCVAGSAIFASPDPLATMRQLRQSAGVDVS
ncbi:MAG: ribulose-phosphate 3-epimerase [Thermoanaerobaculia bacterium]|nr:ribulose-phosphate 3-epimerase [Thermoanaerobaculia bacterium]